jgi:hypothetical protein
MSEADIPHAPEPTRQFYRNGKTFEVADFKDAFFVNGLFLTLVVGTILAEAAVILAEFYRIHVVHLYRSQAATMSDAFKADGITNLGNSGFLVVLNFVSYKLPL